MKISDWEATDAAFVKALDIDTLSSHWGDLHQADQAELPDGVLMDAWLAFHNGDFHTAAELALEIGPSALPVLLRAVVAYTDYVCEDEDECTALLEQAYTYAESQLGETDDLNAQFTTALCMGRYAQSISIVRALKEGLGNKVKHLLTETLKSNEQHAEAHIALGMYHAEIIDKVGGMIGGLTYGASADQAREHLTQGLQLAPNAINLIEAGNAYLLLDGEKKGMKQATSLYQQAADYTALDALQSLDVDFAVSQVE